MKTTLEKSRRNTAFSNAKMYARGDNYILAKAWIERADKLSPLTAMQVWRFKNVLGLEKFNEIATPRLKNLYEQNCYQK